jgi:hypothetical protein
MQNADNKQIAAVLKNCDDCHFNENCKPSFFREVLKRGNEARPKP